MSNPLDLLVVGTGTAGSVVARRCRAAGWRVGIVDSRPFGGTCALRGCQPKKVFVVAADAVTAVSRLSGKGVAGGEPRLRWQEALAFKRTFTDSIPIRSEKSFRKAGIEVFSGHASFLDPHTVDVGGEKVSATNFVLATGARPRPLSFPGADLLATSDDFLDLESLPPRILFVGGGYISFEFAHVAAAAGARAVILQRGDRALKEFDPDLVGQLVACGGGAEVVLHAQVDSVSREADGSLTVRAGDRTYSTDLVVHGAGRVAAIDDLGLERGQVERTPAGVKVDPHLRSVSNPAVYAAGDCADSPAPPLNLAASIEGKTVARNLLEGGGHRPDTRGLSNVVFSSPPLASVGMSEKEAKATGRRLRIERGDATEWANNRRAAAPCAGYKVLIDEATDEIVGAHFLGPGAPELASLVGVAVRCNLSAGKLAAVPYAYPTFASDLPSMLLG